MKTTAVTHVSLVLLLSISITPVSADLKADTDPKIERFRKGGLLLKITDTDGKPCPGAKVSVTQKTHDYRFGVAVDCRISDAGYWNAVKSYYNFGVEVNALKWRNISRFSSGLQAVDKMRSYGHKVRAHTVFWGRDNMDEQGTSVSKSKLEAHAKDVVGRTKGKVVEWDLNNEILNNQGSINCNYTKQHGEGLWKEMAGWAWGVDPNIKLFFNEFGCEGEKPKAPFYASFIKRVLASGVPKEKVGIGLQAHMSPSGARGENLTADYLNRCLFTMGELGIPLTATEFDYDATSDAELAKNLELFYRVWFAHPMTNGVIQWGFWGNGGYAPGKRLWYMRTGNDFKATGASANAYKNLVFTEWWTKSTSTADAAGSCSLGVFYGTHTVRIEYLGKVTEYTLSYPHPRNGSASLSQPSTTSLKAQMTALPPTIWGQVSGAVDYSIRHAQAAAQSIGTPQTSLSITKRSSELPYIDLRGRRAGAGGIQQSSPMILVRPAGE